MPELVVSFRALSRPSCAYEINLPARRSTHHEHQAAALKPRWLRWFRHAGQQRIAPVLRFRQAYPTVLQPESCTSCATASHKPQASAPEVILSANIGCITICRRQPPRSAPDRRLTLRCTLLSGLCRVVPAGSGWRNCKSAPAHARGASWLRFPAARLWRAISAVDNRSAACLFARLVVILNCGASALQKFYGATNAQQKFHGAQPRRLVRLVCPHWSC
jgi:hypothetical protein